MSRKMKRIRSIQSASCSDTEVSGIHLGLSLPEFLNEYTIRKFYYSEGEPKVKAEGPCFMVYTYYRCVSFKFNLMTMSLYQIELTEGYTGNYMAKIRIGNLVGELRKLKYDFIIDRQAGKLRISPTLALDVSGNLSEVHSNSDVDSLRITGFRIGGLIAPDE